MLTLILAALLQSVPAPGPGVSTIIESIPPLAPGETETQSRVRFTVTPEGRAADCTIVESNAPEDLQAQICRIFTERAKFTPRIENGVAVAATDEKLVRFRLRAEGDDTPDAPLKLPEANGRHPTGR